MALIIAERVGCMIHCLACTDTLSLCPAWLTEAHLSLSRHHFFARHTPAAAAGDSPAAAAGVFSHNRKLVELVNASGSNQSYLLYTCSQPVMMTATHSAHLQPSQNWINF